MRKTGYTLLILGFVFICWAQGAFYAVGKAETYEHSHKIPAQQSYTLEDVQNAIRDALISYASKQPPHYIGALFMLVGGILLDVAGRRKQKPQ